jgi:hypothetical protein
LLLLFTKELLFFFYFSIVSPFTAGLLGRFAHRNNEGVVANWLEGFGWLDICAGLVGRLGAPLLGLG